MASSSGACVAAGREIPRSHERRRRTANRGPQRGLLRENPSERLFRGAEAAAGAAARNPVGPIRSATATIDLDGVTGGGFAWVAVAGGGVLIIISIATAGCEEM